MPDETVAAILPDGHSLLAVSAATHISLDIFRVDLNSGKRELFRKIAPQDSAGLFMFPEAFFSQDGKHYAYAYNRNLSALYSVDGLR